MVWPVTPHLPWDIPTPHTQNAALVVTLTLLVNHNLVNPEREGQVIGDWRHIHILWEPLRWSVLLS